MQNLLLNLNIQINEAIYLKNPESSDLGKNIIKGSIDLIDKIGFDAFTFRKLAKEIETTEASVYRYFESKNKLLLYLTSWYWTWMEYRLLFVTTNIGSAKKRLERAIDLLTLPYQEDGNYTHINETKLNAIVITESSKTYLNKDVDEANKAGAFMGYKQLVHRISEIIIEMNPAFKYPHMLISTVIEGAHHQRYFAAHLPKLTDNLKGEDSVTKFYRELVFKAIK